MDTSNLTSASLAAFKARPGSGAAVPVTDAGQSTKAAVAATATTVSPVATALATTAPVEQPSLNRPVEEADVEKVQSQNLVQDTLRKLNELVQTSIAFSLHEETGRTVITVSDKETGEEIRTIPSEDFLAIAAHLEEVLDSAEGLKPGLLVSSQA